MTNIFRFSLRFLDLSPTRGEAAARVDPGFSSELMSASRMTESECFAWRSSSPEGLSESDAANRLALHGPNLIAQEKPPSLLREFLERAANPLNALLATLAAASWLLGDVHSSVVVLLIVLLATLMAFVQEHRSNDAAARLRSMVTSMATVKRRDGEEAPGVYGEIPFERLVPGDVLRLSAGDMIPADLRLLSSKELFLNQSALTGEGMPVEKSAASCGPDERDPFEAPNLCMMGASVVSGFATAMVVHTGAQTCFGRLADRIAKRRESTSFDKGVNRFIWLMIRFMLVMAPTVFLINGLAKGDWGEAMLFSVAVAVGLTPELLPMIVTVNLAKGAIEMSKRRVIVKRLNAIQNFGAMDVLCTDKTGTLTQNRVVLSLSLDLAGASSERVLEYAWLSSHFQSGLKNLLDDAVLEHVRLGENLRPARDYALVDEIPFDFARRRLSVALSGEAPRSEGFFSMFLPRMKQRDLLICKGAVEEVLSICAYYELSGKVTAMSAAGLEAARARARALNEDGLRVIAVATKNVTQPKKSYSVADERGLTLQGFVAFLDPPKEDAAAALGELARCGVAVKILTGDNEIVTRKICREVGLDAERVALGAEFEAMDDAALAELVESVDVFAKVSPEQKARVIRALHSRGHVVGYLGDGVNDGPALKAADVGISVDTAVDIARESADIILLDKNLTVLKRGVIEGRKVFGNIVKYIKMGASSNFGTIFSVLGASLFLPFLPMLPVQVLTNNLLYDFSQTAIPTDNVDDDYLERPRKWDIDNLFKFMLAIGPVSSIFDYLTFYVLVVFFDGLNQPALFQTGWFVESLLTQTLIVHIIRTAKIPFFQSRPSAALAAMSILVCAIGVILPFTRAGEALSFRPLPEAYWPVLAAIVLAYGLATQLAKSFFLRRFGT
jgi:P-type Mg2+ transporter